MSDARAQVQIVGPLPIPLAQVRREGRAPLRASAGMPTSGTPLASVARALNVAVLTTQKLAPPRAAVSPLEVRAEGREIFARRGMRHRAPPTLKDVSAGALARAAARALNVAALNAATLMSQEVAARRAAVSPLEVRTEGRETLARRCMRHPGHSPLKASACRKFSHDSASPLVVKPRNGFAREESP